jgi:membrane-associated protein
MLGYLLGSVTLVRQHFEKVILLIIFISLLPILIEWVKHRSKRNRPDPVRVPAATPDSD